MLAMQAPNFLTARWRLPTAILSVVMSVNLGCNSKSPLTEWDGVAVPDQGIPSRDEIADHIEIKQWHSVPGLNKPLAQFETVFWEPRDTDSLRVWLAESEHVLDKTILEIGTGTGLVSMVCLTEGARRVVATDINPLAFANAAYNAEQLGYSDRFEPRLVDASDPRPFAKIETEERFDFILSNPPWEDSPVGEVAAYALYDPQFQLLDQLLMDAQKHMVDGGQLLLAYGAKTAIQRIQTQAPQYGWEVTLADERNLNDLPEVFVPAMLLILTSQK